MSKHTPWTVSRMKSQPGHTPVIYDSNGEAVAMRHHEMTQERWDELAPLITAAPELLEALQDLTDRVDVVLYAGYVGHERIAKARAAIAKAKGE